MSRRSSHYSLFPSCSQTTPLQSPFNAPPNAHMGSSRNLRKRYSEGSLTNDCRPNINNNLNNHHPHVAITTRKQASVLIPFKLEASSTNKRSSQKSYQLLPPAELVQAPIPASLNPPNPPLPSKRSRPAPVPDLTILPYTSKEWATVMEEVRMLYSRGQYKHCATRCRQILDGIKDPYGVHPLYSIYLSFFAASSLEMTASALHNSSSTKLPLFQESLAFYQKAESFAEHGSVSSDPNVANAARQNSMYGYASRSSISSSIRSSVDSVFSQASASSSYCDSPTLAEFVLKRRASNSSSSEESEGSRRRSDRLPIRKKKVSFSDQLHALDSETSLDPPKRVGTAVDDAPTLLDAFPAPPSKESSPVLTSSRASPRIPSPTNSAHDSLSVIFHVQSVRRYRIHLTSLKAQLDFHISFVHSQIATLSEARRPRPTNSPTQDSPPQASEEKSKGVSGEGSRRLGWRQRIERLKEQGWKRKRFDGERYRVLCETALGEVSERPST